MGAVLCQVVRKSLRETGGHVIEGAYPRGIIYMQATTQLMSIFASFNKKLIRSHSGFASFKCGCTMASETFRWALLQDHLEGGS